MGEMWMTLWVLAFIGLLIVAVSIYDYADRKRQNREIRKWKYALAILISLILLFPAVSGALIPLFTQLRGMLGLL